MAITIVRPSFSNILEILTNQGNLRGVDVIGETILTVTNKTQDFYWADYGLILHIPPASLPTGVEESSIEIKASLAGKYEFPNHTTLVSAVYWIKSPLVFSRPLVLEIQHCAKRAEVSRLSFAVAKCSQKYLPYQFKPLQGGMFNSSTSYGSITLSHFSGFAINHNGIEDVYAYCARHFYIGTNINSNVDFVVTKDLEADITAVTKEYNNKGAIPGPDQDIEFELDEIELKIEEPIPMGWSIRALAPMVIKKMRVDSYVSGRRIPSCHLQVRWTKDQPPMELHHRVNLLGAGESSNFFIIQCGFLSAGTSTSSSVESTQANTLEKTADGNTTWEYRVFAQNYAEIIAKLANVKLAHRVADKLNAASVIGQNVTELAYNAGPGVVESDRVRPVIDAVKDQIQQNPGRYYEFRDILLSLGADADTSLHYIPEEDPTVIETTPMEAVNPSTDQGFKPSQPLQFDMVNPAPPPVLHSRRYPQPTRLDSTMDQKHPTRHAIEQRKMTIEWTTFRDTPEGMRRGSAVTHNKMAYFNPDRSTNVYQFDAEKDHWMVLPNCPHYYSALTIVNSQLTTVGGSHGRYGGIPTNTLAILSGEGKDIKWVEHFQRMPTSRYGLAAVCKGRTLITAGGHDGRRRLATVEVLDTESLQWIHVPSLPDPMWGASITVCGNQLYLLGGWDQNGRTRSVFTCSMSDLLQTQPLDTQLEKTANQLTVWHQITDTPHYRSTAINVGEVLLVIGGLSAADEKTSAIISYDLTSHSWQDMENMTAPRSLPLVTLLTTNELIVVGGSGGLSKVEIGKIIV